MDLNLLPLARQSVTDQSTLPGLHVATKPRRTARGRHQDQLILHFAMEGNAPLPLEQQKQILDRLAQTYYKTPGSVTAALREVAETLNQYLLDRNLRGASSGQQGVGLLSMFVLREERFYLAQCGSTHAFFITASETQHYYDPEATRRGLGLGRTTPIHYAQAMLKPNDILLLTPQPPLSWTSTTLSGLHSKSLENISRYLTHLAGLDVNALLIQAQPGSGQIRLLAPKPVADKPETKISPQEETPEALPETQAPSDIPVFVPEPLSKLADSSAIEQEFDQAPPVQDIHAPATPSVATTKTPTPPSQTSSPPKPNPIRNALSSTSRGLALTLHRFSQSLQTFVKRMLPGEGIFTLPSSVMLFSAVAVPLVVVTIATVVYFQRGRAGQHETYYAQAVQYAGFARGQTEPQARQQAWETVLTYLDQAETYQITAQSQALRSEAQLVFDELNKIVRLDFQTALSVELPSTTSISHFVATDSDLYLLDSSTGQVLRAFLTGTGYELDETFQCGPGIPGSQDLGPLIDIGAFPKGEGGGASLMGMDASGNLLHCVPGEQPLYNKLTPPATNWGQPQAFTLDLGHLYVLDPQGNAVWIYWNSDFTQPPQFFFGDEVPVLEEAIDLTVDKNDLYVLHGDGHLTQCTFSDLGVSPTRCLDPAPYSDSRPGLDGQQMAPMPSFTQIISTQPPDPSLFILESVNPTIYHFSLRLTYQRQLRPRNDVPEAEPATAFTISPNNRIAFLAQGNQIYFAGMP